MKKTWLDQSTPEIVGGDMLLLMAGDLAMPMIGGIGSAMLFATGDPGNLHDLALA